MNPAQIIWEQITLQTKMAVAARNAMHADDGNTLFFQITIKRGQTHKIQVTYDKRTDSYSVKLWHIRGVKQTVKKECEGVYVGQLNQIVYDYSLDD
jgi:hypothetical protein